MHEVLPAVEGRAVEWSVEPARWPTLVADPALLQAALGQLLANAAKFTRGRAPAQIRIQLEETPSEWRIAVGDNGAGFDPAYADRLFTPFERLHTASEFEGNGIGLAIVKLVAQRHGGRVEAEGHPGEGARVAFTLRRPSGPVRESAPHDGEASALPPAGGARALRVLLADDEALVLGTLQGMLERLGCEVTVASGGPAALQLLERHAACGPAFDLVISDWLMPHVTGPQLARAARQMFPDARVVLLTGQRPQVDGSYPTPASVDEVLGKPVRSGSLREVLSRVQRD
jgi:CheY-like chemotaxis protein